MHKILSCFILGVILCSSCANKTIYDMTPVINMNPPISCEDGVCKVETTIKPKTTKTTQITKKTTNLKKRGLFGSIFRKR